MKIPVFFAPLARFKPFAVKYLYDPKDAYKSGQSIDNRMLAGRSVYQRPAQIQFCKPGWHELIPTPVEGGPQIMVDWRNPRILGTQAGAADRNAMIADLYLKEVT